MALGVRNDNIGLTTYLIGVSCHVRCPDRLPLSMVNGNQKSLIIYSQSE